MVKCISFLGLFEITQNSLRRPVWDPSGPVEARSSMISQLQDVHFDQSIYRNRFSSKIVQYSPVKCFGYLKGGLVLGLRGMSLCRSFYTLTMFLFQDDVPAPQLPAPHENSSFDPTANMPQQDRGLGVVAQ